jgi:hypothetical protein
VADRYREGLSLRKGTATYKGKEITDDYKAEIQNIREFGKEGYLNRLNENLANKQQRLKDFEDMLENETDLSYFEDLYGFSNGEKHYQDYLDRRMNIANNIIPNIKKDINGIKFSIGRTNGINESDIRGGQLYKLSIPKDNVMLREGADSYTRQPKVQKALNQLFEDTGLYKEWDEANGFNRRKKFATDETILYDIQRDLGKTPQEANDLLNNYGIKGISYNGGIDGEARVIFNPDDIQIVRKYYNQPSLYDFLMQKAPNMGAVVSGLEK